MNQIYRTVLGVSITGAALLAFSACHKRSVESGSDGPSNAYQIITGDDHEEGKSHWDSLFNTRNYVYGTEPAAFLLEHVAVLPKGRALDIAMGEGRNAVFLAKKGFSVEGVDFSEVAIRKAQRLAREQHVALSTVNADLNQYTIKEDSYDVILNIDYLQRSLIPQIKRGLRKGGVVVFETHTTEQLSLPKSQGLPREFLVKPGELREMFEDFHILSYRESNDGKNAVASLVARKP